MTRSRTMSRSAPVPVRWRAAGATVGLLPVVSLAPTAEPDSPLGEPTTAPRPVPLRWHLPAAVVVLRSRP